MDKLNELLKEAKPLYLKRKRNKKIAKLTIILIIPILFLISIYNITVLGDNIYIAMNDNSFTEQQELDEFGIFYK